MTDLVAEDGIEVNWMETAPCRMKVEFKVSPAVVRKASHSAIRSVRGMARIPGYRVGKAPEALVRLRYGNEVRDESLRIIHSDCLKKLDETKSFEVAGAPSVDDSQVSSFTPDSEYTFSVEFDTVPEVVLPQYKAITVEAPEIKIDEAMIDETISNYRSSFGQFVTVQEPAESGDMVRARYSSDYVVEDGASDSVRRLAASEDRLFWLSEPEMIPGIIAALTGAKVDEERSFVAEFPADYAESAFAGRSVRYTMNVLEVRRKEPDLDDAKLLERTQVPTMDELRDRVRSNMERDVVSRNVQEQRNRLIEKVLSGVPEFPIPKAFLDAEKVSQLRQIIRRVVRTQADSEQFQKNVKEYEQMAEEMAKQRLKVFFVMRKIAEAEKIMLSEQEMEERIQSLSRANSVSSRRLREYMGREGEEDMKIDMLIEKVVDYISSLATFVALPPASEPSKNAPQTDEKAG